MIGNIGDSTGCITVLWNDNDCKRLVGEEGEYINEFKENWLMIPIKIWIKNDGKNSIHNVVGVERVDLKAFNQGRLDLLMKKMEYR